MKYLLIVSSAVILSACTYGHRDAKLDWTPGPSPAFVPGGGPGESQCGAVPCKD